MDVNNAQQGRGHLWASSRTYWVTMKCKTIVTHILYTHAGALWYLFSRTFGHGPWPAGLLVLLTRVSTRRLLPKAVLQRKAKQMPHSIHMYRI
jgi:hypothetical protein